MAYRATIDSRGRVLIPDRGRLPAGVWMHSGCRPAAVLVNNVAGLLSQASVRLLPATRTQFVPPLSLPAWDNLIERLEEHARTSLPEMLVMRPSDKRRARLMMLAMDAHRRPVLFVKLTRNPPNLLAEQMLAAMASHNAPFWYPRLQGRGVVEDPAGTRWWYSIDEPMPPGPHWPARLSSIERHELARFIGTLLSPQPDPHTRSSHGDLGPWNVRRLAGKRLAVIDWESAMWAPEVADEMWHSVTSRLIGRANPQRVAARVRSELAQLYDQAAIIRAAAFWMTRWNGDEPEEVLVGIAKSQRLQEFERRLATVLELLQ